MRIAEYRGFQYLTALISRQIDSYLESYPNPIPLSTFHYPVEISLPLNAMMDEEEFVIRPDVALYIGENIPEVSGSGEKVYRSPDVLFEIQSPGCGSENLSRYIPYYEAASIREYWLIHPLDRIVIVRRMEEEGRYGKPKVYSEADMVKIPEIEGLLIDLYPVFNPTISDRLIKK